MEPPQVKSDKPDDNSNESKKGVDDVTESDHGVDSLASEDEKDQPKT